MYLINNVKVNIKEDFSDLDKLLSQYIGLKAYNVILKKRSIDSRKKGQPIYICSFVFDCDDKKVLNNKDCTIYEAKEYQFIKANVTPNYRPVIVGFGPAGMFAALTLCYAGLKPIILEKGADVDSRTRDVEEFFKGGKLNYNSNVQFGEGGAGTFSDGKLNTGIKDIRIDTVLKLFHKFSAPKEILYSSTPHIGTDILKKVVKNIRKEIISLGAEVLFNHNVCDIEIKDNKICKIICDNGKEFSCEKVIFALGNSARDTFELFYKKGIALAQKPFSVGVRIEHKQSLIDNFKYKGYKGLPAADYKMAVHLKDGRGVYTFCMCPGGYVINSSSEENSTVTNGMSFNARDGKNANSALLVSVLPEDLKSDHPLAGIEFQREIERKAYFLAGGHFPIAQRVGDFLSGKETTKFSGILPTVKPKTVNADIAKVLPYFVTNALKQALPLLDKKLNGFNDENAVLSAPETRSSSPVKILRDDNFETNVKGIFPAGEGAGYAGGITSSAVDGIKAAEKLIESL